MHITKRSLKACLIEINLSCNVQINLNPLLCKVILSVQGKDVLFLPFGFDNSVPFVQVMKIQMSDLYQSKETLD